MTIEEIINAGWEYANISIDETTEIPKNIEQIKVSARLDFIGGAKFVNKHWQEKTRWIPVKERLPEVRDTPYCIAIKWEDFKYQEERVGSMYIYTEEDIDYISVACKNWKEIE